MRSHSIKYQKLRSLPTKNQQPAIANPSPTKQSDRTFKHHQTAIAHSSPHNKAIARLQKIVMQEFVKIHKVE